MGSKNKHGLAQAFKATKNVAAADSKPPKQVRDPESSRLSPPRRPPDQCHAVLPPLRDMAFLTAVVAIPSKAVPGAASVPSTPVFASPPDHRRTSSAHTISPSSKPRRMENLID